MNDLLEVENVLEEIKDFITKNEKIREFAAEDSSYWLASVLGGELKRINSFLNEVELPPDQEGALSDCKKIMDKFHEEKKECDKDEIARRTLITNIHKMILKIIFEGKSFSEVYLPTVQILHI